MALLISSSDEQSIEALGAEGVKEDKFSVLGKDVIGELKNFPDADVITSIVTPSYYYSDLDDYEKIEMSVASIASALSLSRKLDRNILISGKDILKTLKAEHLRRKKGNIEYLVKRYTFTKVKGRDLVLLRRKSSNNVQFIVREKISFEELNRIMKFGRESQPVCEKYLLHLAETSNPKAPNLRSMSVSRSRLRTLTTPKPMHAASILASGGMGGSMEIDLSDGSKALWKSSTVTESKTNRIFDSGTDKVITTTVKTKKQVVGLYNLTKKEFLLLA